MSPHLTVPTEGLHKVLATAISVVKRDRVSSVLGTIPANPRHVLDARAMVRQPGENE